MLASDTVARYKKTLGLGKYIESPVQSVALRRRASRNNLVRQVEYTENIANGQIRGNDAREGFM